MQVAGVLVIVAGFFLEDRVIRIIFGLSGVILNMSGVFLPIIANRKTKEEPKVPAP